MTKLLFYFFCAFLVLMSFFSYLFVDQNFIYLTHLYTSFSTQNRLVTTILYLIFILSLFSIYIFLIRKEKSVDVRTIVPFVLICLFSYPAILSYDIFNYIATSKVAFFYLENPYIVMPIEFLNDPLLNFTHAANKTALYGPFWIILTFLPFKLSLGNYLLNIFLVKILVGTFYFLTLWIMGKLTDKKSVLFFALSPLVIIETFISGHNDIVMMFFALAAFYLVKKERIFWGCVALILSILVKFVTIVLIPIFIIIVFRRIRNQNINWNKVWVYSFWAVFFVFTFSFLREEIYSWYFIWPLTFLVLVKKFDLIKTLSIFISLGLMIKYIPFMILGSHFGLVPILKYALMIFPAALYLFYVLSKRIYK